MSHNDELRALEAELRADCSCVVGGPRHGQCANCERADRLRDILTTPPAAPSAVDDWPQWVKDAVRNANEAGRMAGRSEAAPVAQGAVGASVWLRLADEWERRCKAPECNQIHRMANRICADELRSLFNGRPFGAALAALTPQPGGPA